MNSTTIAALVGMLVLAACGEKKTEQDTMPGMGNMPGMAGMTMQADSLMPMMRAHLDSMARTPAQFAMEMLVAHDALASRMLDAMGRDMRMMGMRPDSQWTALADSVKRDLAELRSLSRQALAARMGAHLGRMRRLLVLHASMMK